MKCYRCGAVKPAGDFAWRRKGNGQRDSFCRPCRAAYHREHYLANKARYVAQAQARKGLLRLERTRKLIEYFAEHRCVDCAEADPVVLEFDHLRDKRFDVAQGVSYRSWPSVLAEMEKCEVVCANCHARRTHRRRRTVRWQLSRPEE